mmetsp:Transcript_5226/g.16490  ORF Transcript_5226/g.16490 Transcript_5226/m.16490 type:complete len:249 (-) Transcript_5226:1212-1958(-)
MSSGTRVVAPSSHGHASDRFVSNASMASVLSSVRPMSSRPLRRLFLRNGSTSNAYAGPEPSARWTVCAARSTVSSPPAAATLSRSSTWSRGRMTGSMPFLKQLLKKMSANDVETRQRMPRSLMDHGACSRDDPHPKLSPATRIFAAPFAQGALLSTKSARSFATDGSLVVATSSGFSYRSSANAANPRPDRLIVFRNSFGMIMSVSMFSMSSDAAMPVSVVNGVMPAAPPPPPPALLICGPADGETFE